MRRKCDNHDWSISKIIPSFPILGPGAGHVLVKRGLWWLIKTMEYESI